MYSNVLFKQVLSNKWYGVTICLFLYRCILSILFISLVVGESLSAVSSSPVVSLTLPSLLSTGWFQERIQA